MVDHSPLNNSGMDTIRLKEPMSKMKHTQQTVQGCLAYEHRINLDLGADTSECRQTIHLTNVNDSLLTGRYDAYGNPFKRPLTDELMNIPDSEAPESPTRKHQRRRRNEMTPMTRTQPARESDSSKNKHPILRKPHLVKHAHPCRSFCSM